MTLWLDEIDSTNAEARRRAEAGERGPLWIAAKRQTAGIGRRGRSWTSIPGNLFATLLTPADRPTPELSFIAALAVADLALAYVPAAVVALKWPNDLLVAGRKAVGILVEAGPGWMAVGIGVNLVSAPTDTDRAAAALADHLRPEHAAPPTPEQALAELAAAFARWEDLWKREGLAPILQAWEARAPGAHGPCIARLPEETLTGTAEGLDSDGALRLRLDDGSLRRISAGDVFFGDQA